MSHYFHTPTGAEHRRQITARFWDTDWSFTTAAGVFSADGLDLGTAVLLRESAPPSGATRLLDLGCGYGVIAVALAAACPQARVDAVDVNERALELTATNAATNGVGERVHPMLPEQFDESVRYDQIWSNPPIRIGKDALHELLLTWLPRLAPGGEARLVVGKNLGADSLQAWLQASGFGCERIASAKGFRVLRVTNTA
ncbi:MAG: MFS transporter [Actinobacteria bacterium HGW-Actinobacteria-2]|nr:MAG: MFS transporter [Actinobacteria bacterium HGW-Actinobacteria-2]